MISFVASHSLLSVRRFANDLEMFSCSAGGALQTESKIIGVQIFVSQQEDIPECIIKLYQDYRISRDNKLY